LVRLRQSLAARLRGHPSLDQLVAQGLHLGKGTHITQSIYIDGLHPWLISIGDYVTLGPNVAIITHDASLQQHTGQTRLGRVTIEDRAYVGVGAILLPGTVIGEDSVIAAGAVVHGEIPPNSLVMGNPATVSPVKGAVAWQRASAKRAPHWPGSESSVESGITEARKIEQREALVATGSGYVPAPAAPGSPYQLANRS
jgi:maltose O-acetyltransferase